MCSEKKRISNFDQNLESYKIGFEEYCPSTTQMFEMK